MSLSRSLELFFIDGKPDGMLTAEVFNWTGHVLVAPRTSISRALKRESAAYTGVYILVGEDGGETVAYIGEGENISNRLRSHDANKDWWDKAILVTSTGNNLHKAHVQYLESRLVQRAYEVGFAKIENGNNPKLPSLSEADAANMESFLDYLYMVLPALRVDIFLSKTREIDPIAHQDFNSPIFELSIKKDGLLAKAIIDKGDFVVLAGSQCRYSWIGDVTTWSSYSKLHQKLVNTGVISKDIEKDGIGKFTSDYAFPSTSAAGAAITGRATSGPIAWRLEGTKKTYKEWEASNIA